MKVEMIHRNGTVTLDSEQVNQAQISMRADDYFNGWSGEARSFLDVKKSDVPVQELLEIVGDVASLIGMLAVALMAMAVF